MWWLALLIYVAGAGAFWALIADMVRSGHTSAHLMNIVFVVLWPICGRTSVTMTGGSVSGSRRRLKAPMM